MNQEPQTKELKELPIIEPLLPKFVSIDTWIPNRGITWVYEPKFDGVRCLIYWTRKDGIKLLSRYDRNIRGVYQKYKNDLHQAFLNINNADNFILDGELMAISPKFPIGSLDLFQRREYQPTLFQYRVFDFLYFNGIDLRGYALATRKKLLEKYIPINTIGFKPTPSNIDKTKLPSYTNPKEIVVKNIHSFYISGVQTSWMKLKEREATRFFVIGFNGGIADRSTTFGSLKIANEKLEYVGDLYLGFSDQDRELIWTWIAKHCKDRWKAFAVEVFFSRYNTSGQLHQPRFDKVIFPGE